MIIPLDDVKKHLQIDADYYDEDDYLVHLIEVSAQAVEQHINRSLSEYGQCVNVPAPIKQAILLMCGNLYNNREPIVIGTTTNKLPLSYEYLLSPYIKYSSI